MSRIGNWLGRARRARLPFKLQFARFRQILDHNTLLLQLFADATEKLSGEYVWDRHYVVTCASRLFDLLGKVVYDLNSITGQKYTDLYPVLDRLRAEIQGDLAGQPVVARDELCVPLEQIDESQVNQVGGKAAHLGAIRNRLGAPMPDGFAITTFAYLRVLEDNGLTPFLEHALERHAGGDEAAASEIAARLRGARVPSDVRKAVTRAVARMADRAGRTPLYLAVRSSALGEDEDLSFAGQYRTVLQVRPDGVLDAYREVLASLYQPAAIAYRRATGLPAQGLMAVACMRMVEARTSGVLYTVDPNRPQTGTMVLGVTRGLASRAVAGAQGMDGYVLSRRPPHEILEVRGAEVADAVVGAPGGGLTTVGTAGAPGPRLTADELRPLAELALRIERYFKQPQDLEWARDGDGTFHVIQVRQLRVTAPPPEPRALPEALRAHRVLVERCGQVASRGVAAGLVVHVDDDRDLGGFPSGGVLVARRASPRLAAAMPRAAAILTELGSPTGHMAALAREFRVPAIVDCREAMRLLAPGAEVTVDADDCVVYAGRVEELLAHQLVAEAGVEDAPEYRLLRRILRRVTPLYLLDPQADDFRARRCRTAHDVIRFAHEKAVEELIEMHLQGATGREAARRLVADLPIGLYVIDLGGGLDARQSSPPVPGATVRPEAIRSAPMRALWAGMTTPGVWHKAPVGVDLRTFLSSAMAQPVDGDLAGRNLAVLAEDYVNLSLKLGYHYNMVDAYLSDDRDANHVYFRFVGGASDQERRTRRAAMVREILERLDFVARQAHDLVTARLRKLPRAETEERLVAVGRLIGYTRQLDALLRSEGDARRHVEAFLRGDFSLVEE